MHSYKNLIVLRNNSIYLNMNIDNMKQVFQIKDPNRYNGSAQQRIQELEEELRVANENIEKIRKERSCDSDVENELNDVKGKLRVITTKFANVRKERDSLKKENRMLQNEILELQSNMRHMVPGYQNISAAFPMLNEIADISSQFYKCDCQDIFFEMLGPELSMEGIIYFFKVSFPKVLEVIRSYFLPAEDALRNTAGLESLEGPIMNVLRKSYQASWKKLFRNSVSQGSLQRIVDDIQRVLRLDSGSVTTNKQIFDFLQKLAEILFVYYINDPPVRCGIENIGQQVEFNSLHHDAIDGFIRPGDLCVVVLPPAIKGTGELMTRAAVLHVDYEMNM
jgi:archaellum component FlaC